MSMPIQRQSEAYGIFDDGPRFARDRASHDLPRGLAGLVNSTGPRIQAGLLNTRQAGWHTPDYDPRVDGYGGGYYGPSAADMADFAEEDAERRRKETYPRGQGAPWDYDKYGDPDPYLEHLEETSDPERFISGSRRRLAVEEDYSGGDEDDPDWIRDNSPRQQEHNRKRGEEISRSKEMFGSRHPFDRAAARRQAEHDDLPPLPDDFRVPDSPEGQPDRSPGWLHRQFVSPHKGVWDIPEHELDDRWNKVYDTLGFDDKTREQWEAGRHTDDPSDKWDAGMDGMMGGGLKDYLTRAPMSQDEYARHREHSQNRAKELADGLWNAMYPPEEEEGRKAIQNTETINKLMDNGWQPEHIKYDEDDEPYALYQHPSGWNVTDHGGMYKDIGHAATPGEAHDVINVSHNIDGQDYHEPFGPADAHNHIEEQLHGDPEETGGIFQYLTENHPAIRRYKPRQARRMALAPAPQDPAAMAPQVPVGGGFLPGHRVGLDWRDRTIRGTVIANDGQVHVRWDEGQYTSEDPAEVHLL